MHKHTNVLAVCVLAACLMTAIGCAAEVVDDGTSPGAPDGIHGATAALSGSCSGRLDELCDFAFWASIEAIEARSMYEADRNNPLAVRYFGENYDQDLVSARLLRLAQLGRSPRLEFECLEETHADCADPTKVLSTWDTEWLRDDGWRIYVCGDRFWDDAYVNGVDSGNGASQVGIMVHEIAHLTGAISDANTLNEQGVIDAATDPFGSFLSPNSAEAFRFYVMNTPF